MKSIKKRLAVLLGAFMILSVMCISAFAAEGASSGASGTSATVISAFQSMASDAMLWNAVIVPIAVGVAGVIWLSRKAMSWFKSMGQ